MLYDQAEIEVVAGAGGDGSVSFRREAHVPKGGPDGGDGGRGGDVVVVADHDLRDLAYFRHKKHFHAGRGGHGTGKLKHGKNGQPVELKVPVGTTVQLQDGSVFDLAEAGQSAVLARGGSGGYGNKHFTTSTRQAPRFSQRGLPGETQELRLRLKLLADVGLVGMPNAGKSSLLGRLTNARPKVADYPFTTKEPILGTVQKGDRQLILADIPGLIEGAASGSGMGHDFLAHIERTRLLLHLVDIAPVDGTQPVENYRLVQLELSEYGAGLVERPQLVVLNKIDLIPANEAESLVQQWAKVIENGEVVAISSVDGRGLEHLTNLIFACFDELGASDQVAPSGSDVTHAPATFKHYKPKSRRAFEVVQRASGSYEVTGSSVERLMLRTDPANPEALDYLERKLHAIGVVEALIEAGFESGDEVVIGDQTLNLYTE